MNSVNLIGRLTRDPELVTTAGGTDICRLRLAVDRVRRDGAVFLDVKCFEGQARACAEHLSEGREVAVTGRLELDEWEAEGGGKRSRLYVIGERVKFLRKPAQPGSQEQPAEEPVAVGSAESEDVPF
jgi:single-strand DNA-binding protein